ncbi:MAG: hypothetical protein ACJ74W_15010 [Pyrinomonadaceae bacterium]
MRTVLIIGSLIAFSLCSSECFACDCLTPSAEESFRKADAVFIGEVIRSDESFSGNTNDPFYRRIIYTFRVSKSLKGIDAPEILITSLDSDCDFSFGLHTTYLVYAYSFGGQYAHSLAGQLGSSSCSGNTALGISTQRLPNRRTVTLPPNVPAYRDLVVAAGVGALLASLLWLIAPNSRRRAA